MAEAPRVRAVILVGGPTRATRFRPLSFNLPKPLFPLAGKPMIWHHIEACKRELPGLVEVLLLGSFNPTEFQGFVEQTQEELKVPIEYIKEDAALGTAGGLFANRARIGDKASYFFVLHSDICCSFPLKKILDFHVSHGKQCTMMGTQVPRDIAVGYGCFVADENHKMLHYAERPESFISDTINAGVYCFSKSVLGAQIRRTPSKNDLYIHFPEHETIGALSMERDVLPHLGEKEEAYIYSYTEFWRAIKHAGSALYANDQYLKYYGKIRPEWIAQGSNYVGSNVVDATAKVDPSAKIGPNVYIGPGVVVGKGVRISNTIVLSDCSIKDRSCVMYSILSSNTTVGVWSRIEGLPSSIDPVSPLSKQQLSITVLGNGVTVDPELVIRCCIVMPHKQLTGSSSSEIIL